MNQLIQNFKISAGQRFPVTLNNGCYLRMFKDSDSGDLYDLTINNMAYLKPWFAWAAYVESKDDTLEYIRRTIREHDEGKTLECGIWHKKRLNGVISIVDVSWTDRKAALGYWIDSGCYGMGLASSACSEMIDLLFSLCRINRIEINCSFHNESSKKVAEHLGFKLDGVLRDGAFIDGKFANRCVYSLLRNDWNAMGKE